MSSNITKINYYPCPCCGYRVHARPCVRESCPICNWEDDEEQLRNPHSESDPNGISLWKAQRNFMKSGLSKPGRPSCAIAPTSSEHRDEFWRPIVARLDDFGEAEQRSKAIRYEELCYWRDTFWNSKYMDCTSTSAVHIDLERAHGFSIFNRHHILQSELCGCFYCLEKFPPSEITEWVDGRLTPICPHCGIDSVIGAASGLPITDGFLKTMNRRWFG